MLHISNSGYSFLVAVNLRVQVNCKVANRVHRGEDSTAMKEDVGLCCCLKAHKGIPCLCCHACIWWYLRYPQGF